MSVVAFAGTEIRFDTKTLSTRARSLIPPGLIHRSRTRPSSSGPLTKEQASGLTGRCSSTSSRVLTAKEVDNVRKLLAA